MEKSNIETFAYTIKKIQTVNFDYTDITEKELELLIAEPELLKINLDVDWRIFRKDSKIEIDIISKLVRNSDREILFHHSGRTIFGFINLNFFYNTEKGIFDIPNGFVNELNSMSYAHSRALLAVKLKSTVYEDKFFLPIVEPELFLKNLNYTLN